VSKPRTHFILVRHGETEWNRLGRIQGHLDSPLNEQGVAQAQSIAARLEREPFDRLLSSDLGRAITTARIIAARTGHQVQADARLRERHYGIFQGLTRVEARLTFPAEYTEYEAEDVDHSIPGGESTSECFRRNLACLQELATNHVAERLVVVTHGGVLDGLRRHALGLSHVGARVFTIVNGSLNWFTYDGELWTLERWGDAAHLRHGEALDDV